MAIPQELYELSSRDPDGSIWKGARREIITGLEAGTTAFQLLPEQSGALIVSNALTGAVYTLPTPVPGMWFEFWSQLATTSNEYKVITKTIATEFILGAVTATHATVASSGTAYPSVVATVNVSINLNGTDTGGIPGDNFILTAISTTLWMASGWNVQSGTTATPWSTS
jgi:hypothetical protein